MDAPKKTPQGFLAVPAYLTRSGVFNYVNADGTPRREWRPSSEVMRADAIASLISAPVTDEHPPVSVTVENRAKYDRGNVGENIIRDGGKIAATLYVKDGRLIRSIERGDKNEVSCGYVCDVDMTPGVVPDGEPDAGEHYDAVQRGIAYNHVAAVPRGRAGAEVRMHLDADDNVIAPSAEPAPQEKHMTKERIDGVDYEVGTEPHKAALARRDAAEKAAKDERDALQARADAAELEAKKLRADIAEMPAKLAEQVKGRAALESNARKLLGSKVKLDALTDAQIRAKVAAKGSPELKLDGKSEAYVEALYDRAVARVDELTDRSDLDEAREGLEDVDRDDADDERLDVEDEYEAMRERELNRWNKAKG